MPSPKVKTQSQRRLPLAVKAQTATGDGAAGQRTAWRAESSSREGRVCQRPGSQSGQQHAGDARAAAPSQGAAVLAEARFPTRGSQTPSEASAPVRIC